jgi:hypothetical protein
MVKRSCRNIVLNPGTETMTYEHPVMVVHGPEIFDRGYARLLNDQVRPARVIVAGVMARTAAEESGLLVEFAGKPPSEILGAIEEPVFLANCAKITESGRIFGQIIAARLGNKGLVHLECADQLIYLWNFGDHTLAEMLSARTGYRIREVTSPGEETDPAIRKIRGCLPGEPVFINGIIIGHATERTVIVRMRDGVLEPVSGIDIKPHGLEKLAYAGLREPGRAWCKSGVVRRSPPGQSCTGTTGRGKGKVVVIDHCGFDLYSKVGNEVSGVLAIGDDTTAICGHICAHLGIPVFGIIDGDEDGIVGHGFAPGSVVVMVTSGRDDDLGREIAANTGPDPVDWVPWVKAQVASIGNRGHVIIPKNFNGI